MQFTVHLVIYTGAAHLEEPTQTREANTTLSL